MKEEHLMFTLERLESLVREGLLLRGAGVVDCEEYGTALRGAVEDYLHSLREEQRRHHPNWIPVPQAGRSNRS